MPPQQVSPIAAAFVSAHVRTLDELQLLMAVVQSPDRWWDAESASRELGMSVPASRAALEHFGALNLVDIRISGTLRYQFHPGTPELREAAMAAADAYRRAPLEITTLVQPSLRRSVSDFADAFRIRRNDDR